MLTTTLSAAIDSSQTTIPLASRTGIIAKQTFLQVGAETMSVEALLDGNAVRVVRGYSGTSAISHAASYLVTVVTQNDIAQGSSAASDVEALDFSTLSPAPVTTGAIMTTGTSWINFAVAGACGIKLLLQNTCATGEFATLRLRARANNTTASGNGGNSVGTTTCADFSASANGHEYGNLKAVNACAQPNALNQTVDATNIVTALYGRIDATGTSVGRRWVGWLDTHATTKADGGDYMQRISHNGTAAIDGCFTVYSGGRLPVLFNFEDVAGFLSASGGGETFTKTHKVAVTIAGVGTRYIEVGTCA